tara:strand:- start:10 stop:186 length:177 start_codon:yes stop_codon:yes gene_type:complete
MNFATEQRNCIGLEMDTEHQYRLRAESYRSSPEYSKMVSLYPILKTSIKDCQDECLVA